MLSVVLLIGISLLPKSAPVVVPAAAATASVTAPAVVLETPTIHPGNSIDARRYKMNFENVRTCESMI